jgi:hypothetical protein
MKLRRRKMTHFNFHEWQQRMDLDEEDLIDWLGLSDDQIEHYKTHRVPKYIEVACKFIEWCYCEALDELHVNVLHGSEPYIKAHYPAVAAARGAFVSYALNNFYEDYEFDPKRLKSLLDEVAHQQGSYKLPAE